MRADRLPAAVAYVSSSLVAGLVASALGYVVART